MIATSYFLLIDDDETTNFINQIIIQKSGVTSEAKALITATEALNFLKQCLQNDQDLPEVILLDINMPEIDGWEFLEQFSNLDPKIQNEIKLYMLSSSQNEADVMKADNHPFVSGFLHKPLEVNKLIELFGSK